MLACPASSWMNAVVFCRNIGMSGPFSMAIRVGTGEIGGQLLLVGEGATAAYTSIIAWNQSFASSDTPEARTAAAVRRRRFAVR